MGNQKGRENLLRLLQAQQRGDTAGMARIRSKLSGRDIEDVLDAATGELAARLVAEIGGDRS